MNDQYFRDACAMIAALSDEEIEEGLREHGITFVRRASPAAAVPEALEDFSTKLAARQALLPPEAARALHDNISDLYIEDGKAAAVPEGALPPLSTEKLLQIIAANTGQRINMSLGDLDLYLAVARAAVEADRAQQGEPVGECWRCIACNKPKAEIETECGLCGGSSFKVSILATKAAAPADAPADPLDWPLPCDVKVGPGTIRKGVALRSLVARTQYLHDVLRSQQGKAYQYDIEHPSDGLNVAAPAPDTGTPTAGAVAELLDAARESLRMHDEVTGGQDYGYISPKLRAAVDAFAAPHPSEAKAGEEA